MDSHAFALHPEKAARPERSWSRNRSSALAQPLLHETRALLPAGCPGIGNRQSPLWSKPLTGEPDAGDPPVRFGGGGGAMRRPYLYRLSPASAERDCPLEHATGEVHPEGGFNQSRHCSERVWDWARSPALAASKSCNSADHWPERNRPAILARRRACKESESSLRMAGPFLEIPVISQISTSSVSERSTVIFIL